MRELMMTLKVYRYISLTMMVVFGLVGVCFLFMSDGVVIFFNQMSAMVGMEEVAPGKEHFYVILSFAYMYIVALLAFLMYRDAQNSIFPFILFNAKIASSAVSILLFFADKHLLIYLINGIVDGAIGLLVIVMYQAAKRASR